MPGADGIGCGIQIPSAEPPELAQIHIVGGLKRGTQNLPFQSVAPPEISRMAAISTCGCHRRLPPSATPQRMPGDCSSRGIDSNCSASFKPV